MPESRTAGPCGQPAAPLRWVWLAAWPVTAVFVLSNIATPLYVLWQQDIGFSKGTLTVVFAFYIVGLIGSLLVSGVVSDRLGRKPVLLPALVLALASCLIFATATSVIALIAARLFTGIAVGTVVSAGMAAVTDVAGPERKRIAALLASCAMVFGAGLGPLLAGVLSETLPAPTVTVFVVEAVLLVTAVLAVLRMPVPAVTPAKGAWVRVPAVPPVAAVNSPSVSPSSPRGSPPRPSCSHSVPRSCPGCSIRPAASSPVPWRSSCSSRPQACSSPYSVCADATSSRSAPSVPR